MRTPDRYRFGQKCSVGVRHHSLSYSAVGTPDIHPTAAVIDVVGRKVIHPECIAQLAILRRTQVQFNRQIVGNNGILRHEILCGGKVEITHPAGPHRAPSDHGIQAMAVQHAAVEVVAEQQSGPLLVAGQTGRVPQRRAGQLGSTDAVARVADDGAAEGGLIGRTDGRVRRDEGIHVHHRQRAAEVIGRRVGVIRTGNSVAEAVGPRIGGHANGIEASGKGRAQQHAGGRTIVVVRPQVAELGREILGGRPVEHRLYRLRALLAQGAAIGIGRVLAIGSVQSRRDAIGQLVVHQRPFVRKCHVAPAPLRNVGDHAARVFIARSLGYVVDRPGEGGPAKRGRLGPLDDFNALDIGKIDARNTIGYVNAVQKHRTHLL